MFFAALMSRSWVAPHQRHCHSRIDRSSLPPRSPQQEQVWLVGSHRFTTPTVLPYRILFALRDHNLLEVVAAGSFASLFSGLLAIGQGIVPNHTGTTKRPRQAVSLTRMRVESIVETCFHASILASLDSQLLPITRDKLSVRVDTDRLEKLHRVAASKRKTMTQMIEDWIDRLQEEKPS